MAKTDTKPDDLLVAERNFRAYTRLRDNGHSDWVERAQKQTDFYLGEQWSQADLAALEEDGRPALTMNSILSTVNTMIGELINNQGDIQFKPQRGGSEGTAQRLNAIFQHVTHENDYRNVEQQLYADGIIEDRGFLDVRISFDDNILGDVSIKLEDGTQVLIDNEARDRDPRTWNEVIITRWFTLDEIEAEYGKEKRNEIELTAQTIGVFDPDSAQLAEGRYYGNTTDDYNTDIDDTAVVKRIRVIERQYYRVTRAKFLIDPQTGDKRDIPSHWEEERIAALQEQYGYGVMEGPKRRVRMTITADRVVLFDDWSPYRTYSVVPFFPYFRRGRPMGVVRNLVSPQELLNKTTSQELHIVNSTANSGWVIEENSLANMTEDELAENGAKTGLVLVHKRTSKAPEKIQPNSMPHGIDRISMKAASSIREISGVNSAMAGSVNAHQVSGVAVREQTERGRVQAIVPEEALNWTRRLLALKVLELVQDFYTEGRVVYVEDKLEPGHERMPVEINEMDEQGNVPFDVTVGRYDVVVSTMPSRDTVNEIEFAQLMQMRMDAGVQIPDHILIEKSNLTNRRELAEFIKNLQGFGELSPEEQERLEMEQELQMRQLQGEVEHLEAKAAELHARSIHHAARAESLDGYNEAQIKLAAIETDLQKKREELQLRSRLAGLSYTNSNNQNHRNNATKLATAALQLQAQRAREKTPKSKPE